MKELLLSIPQNDFYMSEEDSLKELLIIKDVMPGEALEGILTRYLPFSYSFRCSARSSQYLLFLDINHSFHFLFQFFKTFSRVIASSIDE